MADSCGMSAHSKSSVSSCEPSCSAYGVGVKVHGGRCGGELDDTVDNNRHCKESREDQYTVQEAKKGENIGGQGFGVWGGGVWGGDINGDQGFAVRNPEESREDQRPDSEDQQASKVGGGIFNENVNLDDRRHQVIRFMRTKRLELAMKMGELSASFEKNELDKDKDKDESSKEVRKRKAELEHFAKQRLDIEAHLRTTTSTFVPFLLTSDDDVETYLASGNTTSTAMPALMSSSVLTNALRGWKPTMEESIVECFKESIEESLEVSSDGLRGQKASPKSSQRKDDSSKEIPTSVFAFMFLDEDLSDVDESPRKTQFEMCKLKSQDNMRKLEVDLEMQKVKVTELQQDLKIFDNPSNISKYESKENRDERKRKKEIELQNAFQELNAREEKVSRNKDLLARYHTKLDNNPGLVENRHTNLFHNQPVESGELPLEHQNSTQARRKRVGSYVRQPSHQQSMVTEQENVRSDVENRRVAKNNGKKTHGKGKSNKKVALPSRGVGFDWATHAKTRERVEVLSEKRERWLEMALSTDESAHRQLQEEIRESAWEHIWTVCDWWKGKCDLASKQEERVQILKILQVGEASKHNHFFDRILIDLERVKTVEDVKRACETGLALALHNESAVQKWIMKLLEYRVKNRSNVLSVDQKRVLRASIQNIIPRKKQHEGPGRPKLEAARINLIFFYDPNEESELLSQMLAHGSGA